MIRGLVFSTLLIASTCAAAVTVVARESFSDFEALGLQPGGGGGTLDSRHWRIEGASSGDSVFGEISKTGDLARGRSSGGVRSGGLYAFALPDGKRGLGIQASGGDFTPGALVWGMVNQTRQWLSHVAFTYDLWWLNDGPRSTRIETQYSFDGVGWHSLLKVLTPTASDALGWTRSPQSLALAGHHSPSGAVTWRTQAIAPDASLWLRWQFDDAAGSGMRDEFALASLSLLAQTHEAPAAGSAVALNAPPSLYMAALLLVVLSRRLLSAAQNSPSCNATDTCL